MTRLAALLLVATGVTGCDPIDRACAGPCARLSVCEAELPGLTDLGGLFPGASPSVSDLEDAPIDCLDQCATYATLLPEPCDPRYFALLDCMAAQSCEVLQDSVRVAVACSSPLQALFICVQRYRETCCVEDDPCDLEGGDRCVCFDRQREGACPDLVATPTGEPL